MTSSPRGGAGGLRRALRIAAWNLPVAVAGLALAAGAAEIWLRLVWPFAHSERPTVFVPGVGHTIRPGAEVRHTNLLEFWTAQRANGLGFLDREPIDPRRAAESCHVAMIGDSFVEAKEVPIADKFHVRLEELAARTLPGLDVTTSAWGVQSTGTIAQLPLYDVYARRLKPKILVLVVYGNDFRDNTPLHLAYRKGWDPDRHPFFTAVQAENGEMTLRPPNEDDTARARFLARPFPSPPEPWLRRTVRNAGKDSWLAAWVWRRGILPRVPPDGQWIRQKELWLETLGRRPDYAWILPPRGSVEERVMAAAPPADAHAAPPARVRKYLSDFTAFGIDLFEERADRDEAMLVILWVPVLDPVHPWAGGALSAMARERGVPLIDLHDWIARQGADVRESRFAHDVHWNAAGHRWAAEALLEWLTRNRHACGAGGGGAVEETPARR